MKWNEIPTVGYTGSAANKNEEKTKRLVTITKSMDGDYMHYSDGTTEFIPFNHYDSKPDVGNNYSKPDVWNTIKEYCIDDIFTTNAIHKNTRIKNVIFNPPATIVFWADGTKTVVKCCEGETFDPEKGLAMAWMKYAFGNSNRYHKIFKKWIPKEKVEMFKCDVCGKLFKNEHKDNATYKYHICPKCIDKSWKEVKI